MIRHHMLRRSLAIAVLPLVAAIGISGCGSDDDGQSSQEKYCEAGDQLRSDVTALLELDVAAVGTDGLESAIEAVDQSLSDLSGAAESAVEDEVAALEDAMSDVDSALSDVGGELTEENAEGVIVAIDAAFVAADAVYDTLANCP